jgi:hypothetical protein
LRRIAKVVGLAVVLVACAGNGRNAWDAAAVKEAESIAKRLATSGMGCDRFGPYPFDTYAATSSRTGFVVPEAVGNCEALGDDLEISVFTSARQRDRFVERRRSYFCKRSAERDIGFPGFVYVAGETFTIQPDTEAVARRIAPVVGGRVAYAACRADAGLWDDAAVARSEGLGAALKGAGLGCEDFYVADRNDVLVSPEREHARMPAAVATCTAGGKIVELDLFSTEAAESAFVRGRVAYQCGRARPEDRVGARIPYVDGDRFVVFFGDEDVLTRVAAAVGGTLRTTGCPS